MQIRIFDVAHGFCAYVLANNGDTLLIDCGHNELLKVAAKEVVESRAVQGAVKVAAGVTGVATVDGRKCLIFATIDQEGMSSR